MPNGKTERFKEKIMPRTKTYYHVQLAAIHSMKRDLNLDDTAYRDLLERTTGKRSSKDMTELERERTIGFFAALHDFHGFDTTILEVSKAQAAFDEAKGNLENALRKQESLKAAFNIIAIC